MPIPKPKPDESEKDFISRCMGDKVMLDEYESSQRAAICYSAWRKKIGAKILDWKVFSKIASKFQDLFKITVEEGDQYWNVRIENPDKYDPKSFRIININEAGTIRAIVGCPKGKFKNGKCSVGTEIQAYRFDTSVFTKEEAKKWVESHI
jgi:hypothetical protein